MIWPQTVKRIFPGSCENAKSHVVNFPFAYFGDTLERLDRMVAINPEAANTYFALTLFPKGAALCPL